MKKKDHELEEEDFEYNGLIAGSSSDDYGEESDDPEEQDRIQEMRRKLLTGLTSDKGNKLERLGNSKSNQMIDPEDDDDQSR